MNDSSKVSRSVRLLLAAIVALLTVAVLVPATRATTLTANAATINYSTAAGANSVPFTPIADKPVLVMGIQDSVGYRGVGFVYLLHVSGAFLEWTGLESPASAAITSGFSATAGTHIVYLDYSHLVDIRVNSADTFVIHNANTITQTGSVTLIW
jgi:hypothetical protein